MHFSSKLAWFTAVIATTVFSACESQRIIDPAMAESASSAPRIPTFEDRRAAAARVGAWHNTGMEYVRLELKKYLQDTDATREETLLKVQQLCQSYFARTAIAGTCHVAPRGQPRGLVRSVAPLTNLLSAAGTKGRFDYQPTGAAQALLDQITVATDTYTELTGLRSTLDNVDAAAGQQLEGRDLEVVLEVSAVAYSSSSYWETEGQAWATVAEDSVRRAQEPQPYNRTPNDQYVRPGMSLSRTLLAPPSSPMFGWFSWRRVANGDVAGAIAGAIFGGRVAEGALGASLYEASVQVLDYVTGT